MPIYDNVTVVIKGTVDLNIYPADVEVFALGPLQVKTADGLGLTSLRVKTADGAGLTELRTKEI